MGIKDVGFGVLEAAGTAAGNAKAAVDKVVAKGMEDAASKAKEMSELPKYIPNKVKGLAGDVKDKIDNIALPRHVEKKTSGSTNAYMHGNSDLAGKAISTEGAMIIMYYIMAADGCLHNEQLDQFELICNELDPEGNVERERLIKSCELHLSKAENDDYYDYVQDGVEFAIYHRNYPPSLITPKMLLWDMLLIAYSNGEYAENEQKLIKYTARKYNVDKAVLLEMEHTMLTVADIEKELIWIKTQNKPYLEIEKIVNELNVRKQAIFAGVKALVTL